MYYPKILIIGQSFNKKNGGGVTISNLFSGWPKDSIAVASNANLYNDLDTTVCNTYYQLGYNNKQHPFPFSIILPDIDTGLIPITNSGNNGQALEKPQSGRYKKIYQVLTALLHFFGVYNLFYKLKITAEFKKWVQEYNPDIIYTQLASLELINFTIEVHDLLKKPVAVHMMDDWPLTINKPGFFYNYWQHTIDKQFRQLLDKSSIFMSICDAMSEEYKQRYNKDFVAFHNPIDISYWMPKNTKEYTVKEKFTILYAGRIGFGIATSISSVATAVSNVAKTYPNIVFEIQTGDTSQLNNLVKFTGNVKWVKPLDYSQLPKKFSAVDILLLPQDFDKASIKFLKYSFPTKVSEYMISGTPILVFGDDSTCLTKYAVKDQWAYIVTENKIESLEKAIVELYQNAILKQQLATRAQQIAIEKEDSVVVIENFRKCLI
jgi:glycosyltransferase involved in cell wall biosynthesis